MAVEQIGSVGEINGHADAMDAFRAAHELNSRQLVAIGMGLKKNAVIPAYDPEHEDNDFPVMLYHPEKGERIIGKSAKGLGDPKARAALARENADLVLAAKKLGYREEPYVKPQIAILPPEVEKKALQDKLSGLEGQNTLLLDMLTKLQARLDAADAAKV